MTNVTAECEGSFGPERLRRFALELRGEICRKISRLHDHRGVLFVDWAERPTPQEIAAVIDEWGRHENNAITYHYEMGVELVGCVPRYNPFDGSDRTHLAAIEHLRTARDLLKKTGMHMKKNGVKLHTIKRLFQSLKLTESALRHARRSQAIDKNESIEGSIDQDLPA